MSFPENRPVRGIERDREATGKTLASASDKQEMNACDSAQDYESYTAKRREETIRFLQDIFSYHPPRPEDQRSFQAIRSAALHFAQVIIDNAPYCQDQERAILQLREAVFFANAAVALRGRY